MNQFIYVSEVSRPCSVDGQGERQYRVLMGKPQGKRPLGDPGIDGRIILGLILGK
jgi:hypothetical protein